MSDQVHIAAFTEIETPSYPGYVSAYRAMGGTKYVITVRTPGHCGTQSGRLEMSKDDLRKFFQEGLAKLDSMPD